MKPVPNIMPALTLKPLSPMLERLVTAAHKEIEQTVMRPAERPVKAVTGAEATVAQPAMARTETPAMDLRV